MIEIPHIIKYMGSKRNILDFVVSTIEEVTQNENQRLYDIFGGSAVVSGAFRNKKPVTCNDIQSYTSVLAGTYLNNYMSISVLFVPGISVKMCQSERWCNSTKKMLFAC